MEKGRLIWQRFVYLLCALTAVLCAVLLFRSYLRTGTKILFWSGLCFAGLTVNNAILIFDRYVVPETDLSTWRLIAALAALVPMVYGLIWEDE